MVEFPTKLCWDIIPAAIPPEYKIFKRPLINGDILERNNAVSFIAVAEQLLPTFSLLVLRSKNMRTPIVNCTTIPTNNVVSTVISVQ